MNTRTRYLVKSAAVLLAIIAMNTTLLAADFSGKWIAQIATLGEPQYARVSLDVNGTSVTGT